MHREARSLAENVFVAAARDGDLAIVELWDEAGLVPTVDCRSDAGWTALLAATRNGHVDVVHYLLAHGASTASRTKQSYAPLHLAVARGNMAIIQLLCRFGANVNAHGAHGKTALHLASERRLPRIVSYLLDHGASAGAVDDNGDTVLHQACRSGSSDVVLQLVKKLKNVDKTDAQHQLINKPRTSDKSTPLHIAAVRGDARLVAILVQHGADDASGNAPLINAIIKGHVDIVRCLLASGADTETTQLAGCTPLIIASKEGSGSIVDVLLQHGANVNYRNPNGFSALLTAATEGYATIVNSLLQHGADPQIQHQNGWTPLFAAASFGNLGVARLLVDNGADVHWESDDHWTALTLAARCGHTALCALLLERGASTDCRTEQSFTPLHLAAEAGNVEMLRLFCRFGADMDAPGNRGSTALHIAQDAQFPLISSYLLDHGASAVAVDDNGDTAFMRACVAGKRDFVVLVLTKLVEANATETVQELLNKASQDDWTPLSAAAHRGDLRLVQILVRHGADLEMKVAGGSSPLICATMKGHKSVVQFLFVSGANTETTESGADSTPLIMACAQGSASIVGMLLKYGAVVDHRNTIGQSALHKAAFAAHATIVEALLKHGADVEIRNNDGWTPLLAAAQNGYLNVARLLIDHGANIDCQGYNHWAPLTLAARNGHNAMCALLLERGASTMLQTTDGQTALHVAASDDHSDSIRMLLAAGADRNARDFRGRTAAQIAMMDGHFSTAELLDQPTGAPKNALDDALWPRRFLLELYEVSSKNDSEARSPHQVPPSWYIERSSITSVESRPQFETPAARVYLGTWSGSSVVIVEPKMELERSLGVSKQVMKRHFRREVSQRYPLRHPHVVRLYGAGHRGDSPFLVIEDLRNGNLRSYVSKNKHRTWAVLLEAALGLQYLHERGIVHGNLMGDNIRIGDDGLVKLTGFGLFSASDFDASVSFVWKAPESWDAPYLVHRQNPTAVVSDIYSLGMCIIDAVSETLPYACEETAKKNVKELITAGIPPTKPAAFSNRAWDVVLKMICFDHDQRLKISDVVRELAVLAKDETLAVNSHAFADDSATRDKICDFASEFALAFSFFDEHETAGDECETATPHVQVLRRLYSVWRSSKLLPREDTQLVLPRLQVILDRFIHDMKTEANTNRAASFAAVRQRADRIFSFHNDIDRLLDKHSEQLGPLDVGEKTDVHVWRDQWFEHRRRQLQSFGSSLTSVTSLDVETATCLLFELSRRRDAYTSIPPSDIHAACCTLSSMPGVHLPDWFIPRYEVTFDAFQSFSRGAFGSVHHGEWMGSRAVIKIVFADDDAEFEKEVAIWSQLYHPHVLQLFGACHVGEKFLVSEFASLGQLDRYLQSLKKQPMRREREVWRTLYETALGLQYLHGCGIVHCDLKCNNILIGRDGKAKVSDYGLSLNQQLHEPEADTGKIRDDGNESAVVVQPMRVGAPRWKAPEVLNGGDPTAESDVYAFGMCVVEAVTGEYPWGMDARDELVSDHVRSGGALFDNPQGFSDEHWALVVGACRFDPTERLPSAAIVGQLHAFANHAKQGREDILSSQRDERSEPEPETTSASSEDAAPRVASSPVAMANSSCEQTPVKAVGPTYEESW